MGVATAIRDYHRDPLGHFPTEVTVVLWQSLHTGI